MSEDKIQTTTDVVSKLSFPTLRHIIISLTAELQNSWMRRPPGMKAFIDAYFSKLEMVRECLLHYHPAQIARIISQPGSTLISGPTLNSVIDNMQHMWMEPSEFYAVFDLRKCEYVLVDPRIRCILGIEPSQFTIRALHGLDPSVPLYHPDDLQHKKRHALIAYMTMSLPGFTWRAFEEHTVSRFRVGTSMSYKADLRKLGHVVMEKRSYMAYDDAVAPLLPQYVFEKISVFPNMDLEYTGRTFVSNSTEATHCNGLLYMFNAYLMGIAPKYLLILEERHLHDRHKAVATALNKNIRKYQRRLPPIEEQQVGDCLTRTVRVRLQEAINIWDRRGAQQLVQITSDQEAVHYAYRLGLLPIPEIVREHIYSQVGIA